MSKPADRPTKTAGLAIAVFMQQDFHKSTRSIEGSTNNLDSTVDNATEVSGVALSTREMPHTHRARHTQASMYTKGELFPHPAKLYKQFPQSKTIEGV